jgi:hypothetical protein
MPAITRSWPLRRSPVQHLASSGGRTQLLVLDTDADELFGADAQSSGRLDDTSTTLRMVLPSPNCRDALPTAITRISDRMQLKGARGFVLPFVGIHL